jgi:NAD(P)-dependent dehydrogenase (short-subunit alcohol dehydrogenase family)
MIEFSARTAVVTGAGSGIGRATAQALAGGAFVAIAGVDDAGGREMIRLITEAGGSARFFACDLAAPGTVEDVVAAVVEEHGWLDWAHNDAGIAPLGHTVDTLPDEVWHRVVAVNLTGVWRSMKAELAVMRRQRRGRDRQHRLDLRIPGGAAHQSVQHDQARRDRAHEGGGDGVRAARRAHQRDLPGFHHSPMSHGTTTPEIRAAIAGAVPMGRWADPEEIAAATTWRLSDAPAYGTGQSLAVDGGILQRLPGPRD